MISPKTETQARSLSIISRGSHSALKMTEIQVTILRYLIYISGLANKLVKKMRRKKWTLTPFLQVRSAHVMPLTSRLELGWAWGYHYCYHYHITITELRCWWKEDYNFFVDDTADSGQTDSINNARVTGESSLSRLLFSTKKDRPNLSTDTTQGRCTKSPDPRPTLEFSRPIRIE